MSAQPHSFAPSHCQSGHRLEAMTALSLDAVMDIENAAYEFPWSRGNFSDSLQAVYPAGLLLDAHGELLAYFVAMVGVDELHLLNITVAPAHQGNGHGQFLLAHLMSLCRERSADMLWLEVRRSNARAQAIYRRFGFADVGVRRGYYPAAQGCEDAVVMRISTAARSL